MLLGVVASQVAPAGLTLCLLLLGLAGCATSGPNHIYVTTEAGMAVQDIGESQTTMPRAINGWEHVLGLAYDYNTDHVFARIWPQQIIRVIERPSGQILREMPLPLELHALTPADLAVRSSDRHLFAVHPLGHSVVELTLFGEITQRIEFPLGAKPITGLAYDQIADRLLLLRGNIISVCTKDGHTERPVTLQAPIRSVSLGYDSAAGHFFVPLAEGNTLGEFDGQGALLRKYSVAGNAVITAIDAGPRSLVRVF